MKNDQARRALDIALTLQPFVVRRGTGPGGEPEVCAQLASGEVWPVDSPRFRDWLCYEYLQQQGDFLAGHRLADLVAVVRGGVAVGAYKSRPE